MILTLNEIKYLLTSHNNINVSGILSFRKQFPVIFLFIYALILNAQLFIPNIA